MMWQLWHRKSSIGWPASPLRNPDLMNAAFKAALETGLFLESRSRKAGEASI